MDEPVASPVYKIVCEEYSKLGLLVRIKTNKARITGTVTNSTICLKTNLMNSIIFIIIF